MNKNYLANPLSLYFMNKLALLEHLAPQRGEQLTGCRPIGGYSVAKLQQLHSTAHLIFNINGIMIIFLNITSI